MAEIGGLPTRDQVRQEDTWSLEDIFHSDESWETEYSEISAILPQLAQFKGMMKESADQLLGALEFEAQISQQVGKLYTYAHMRHDQDTTNTFYQSMNNRASTLYAQAQSHASYMVPEILAMPEGLIEQFLSENSSLALYRHLLNKILNKKEHFLSDKEEALLAQAGDVMRTASDTFSSLNNADLNFGYIEDAQGQKIEVTHGKYTLLLENSNPKVREAAFKAVYKQYGDHKSTFASTLSGAIKQHNFFAKARNYPSARASALSNNDIPEQVYDQLVETVGSNLDLLHEYIKLRKRVMQRDELHMYDLFVPLVSEIDYKVTYEEAQGILLEALAPMGEEYLGILKEAFEERWVDVYENKGKRSGAYSSGTYGTKPYILMNWQDNMNNLFTLAHEFGHSVHSYYTRKTQPYIYGDYSIFVAEVASTCNEVLLTDYLIKRKPSAPMLAYILNHYLDGFRATLFRQTMFAEFEHDIHQREQNNQPLTYDLLSSLYLDLNKKYYGPDMFHDPEIALEWARIPHFYYNYYVYQYATGFSAASALANQILDGGQPAVDRYLNFLKAGNSDYPIEVLKKAGIDMTLPDPIQSAMNLFKERMTQLGHQLDLLYNN